MLFLLLQVADQAGEMIEDGKKFAQYTYPQMSRTQVASCSHKVLRPRDVASRLLYGLRLLSNVKYDSYQNLRSAFRKQL